MATATDTPSPGLLRNILSGTIDPRLIYLFVAVALAMPLISDVKLPPARMFAAEDMFSEIDRMEPQPGKIVFIAADWGPGTSAENEPQTRLVIEHLMRKRIPFALISLYQLAKPMLQELPRSVAKALSEERPGETWIYGKDWVNLGYQVAGAQTLQSLSKSANIQDVLRTDANLVPLSEIPVMREVKSIKDVQLLVHITGLVGVFNTWLQFFQSEGYRPPMLHGCTSITIPEAYIYYDSRQIVGFFEGIAGAAWYDTLLTNKYPARHEVAFRVNTGVAFAQLVILGFIVLGNIAALVGRFRGGPR